MPFAASAANRELPLIVGVDRPLRTAEETFSVQAANGRSHPYADIRRKHGKCGLPNSVQAEKWPKGHHLAMIVQRDLVIGRL